MQSGQLVMTIGRIGWSGRLGETNRPVMDEAVVAKNASLRVVWNDHLCGRGVNLDPTPFPSASFAAHNHGSQSHGRWMVLTMTRS